MSDDTTLAVREDRPSDLAQLVEPERLDGFRKRRKRPKGWMERAIKAGEIRDPALGPLPPEEHPAGTHIINVPVMNAGGTG